jgi:hypothetical protein
VLPVAAAPLQGSAGNGGSGTAGVSPAPGSKDVCFGGCEDDAKRPDHYRDPFVRSWDPKKWRELPEARTGLQLRRCARSAMPTRVRVRRSRVEARHEPDELAAV